jgi:hypothetical protein
VASVKAQAENQQLSNIADYVAAKSMQLVADAPAENFSLKIALDIPQLIGNQRYWVQVLNDSSNAWVQTGFGASATASVHRTVIPSEVVASGVYVSGSGVAFLQYQCNSSGYYLTLIGGS